MMVTEKRLFISLVKEQWLFSSSAVCDALTKPMGIGRFKRLAFDKIKI